MGYDITYKCLGGNQYEFILTLYRDCDGIELGATADLNFESTSCGQSFTETLDSVDVNEVSEVCPSSLNQTTCNGGNIPGTEEVIYKDTLTLPANCSDWVISYENCCRNDNITNLDDPNSGMYTEVSLDNTGGLCNNSPTYSSNPVPYICSGQLFTFNHGATDPDADSLVYSLVEPLEDSSGVITSIGYSDPNFTADSALSTATNFTMDSTTGT
ncbi:MAG: hypothetical protein ABEH43_01145, partial [Flavobacteriales bacterium]